MRILFYDKAIDILGGGQRYACQMAAILSNEHDVSFILKGKADKGFIEKAYNVDFSRVNVIPIPKNLFLKIPKTPLHMANEFISEVGLQQECRKVSCMTKDFDLFVNCEMSFQVKPLSKKSILITPFPRDFGKGYYSLLYKMIRAKNYIPDYDIVLCYSQFSKDWIRKLWGVDARILSPFCGNLGKGEKGDFILSVSRFTYDRSKKQAEMLRAFKEMVDEGLKGWTLILAGASRDIKPEKAFLEELIMEGKGYPVSIEVNASHDKVCELYATSKIFWHLCGLGVDEEKEPKKLEHFGMTTVEAMQNGCVPVVFNGGGQREIVTEGINGFLVNNLAELKEKTFNLINNNEMLATMGSKDRERARDFDLVNFERNVFGVIKELGA